MVVKDVRLFLSLRVGGHHRKQLSQLGNRITFMNGLNNSMRWIKLKFQNIVDIYTTFGRCVIYIHVQQLTLVFVYTLPSSINILSRCMCLFQGFFTLFRPLVVFPWLMIRTYKRLVLIVSWTLSSLFMQFLHWLTSMILITCMNFIIIGSFESKYYT